MMTEKKPRGGARKKAGKPPTTPGETMVHSTFSVPELVLRKLRVIGDGNVSEGIRLAAELAYDRYQRQP